MVKRMAGNGAGGIRRNSMFDYAEEISLGNGERNVHVQ